MRGEEWEWFKAECRRKRDFWLGVMATTNPSMDPYGMAAAQTSYNLYKSMSQDYGEMAFGQEIPSFEDVLLEDLREQIDEQEKQTEEVTAGGN